MDTGYCQLILTSLAAPGTRRRCRCQSSASDCNFLSQTASFLYLTGRRLMCRKVKTLWYITLSDNQQNERFILLVCLFLVNYDE